MKKLIALVSFLILGSCAQEGEKPTREELSYKIVVLDSCEYIAIYGNNSQFRYGAFTHKGNCKNCKK